MQKIFLALSLIGLALCQPNFLYAAAGDEEEFDAPKEIIHHISDANEFHIIGDIALPLPCILYDMSTGALSVFLSSKFEHGRIAVDGYVMDHGTVKKVQSEKYPKGKVPVEWTYEETGEGEQALAVLDGEAFTIDRSGFLDFSITKIVFGMIVGSLIMLWLFLAVAKGYKRREGLHPKGIQSFFEPLIIFVRDDIARPNLGDKADKYLPFLLTVFFFIWINNMLGLVPIFPGSANVTGNLMITGTLAVFTLILTNVSGNKDYWRHIFWMPGLPVPVKILLAPIELVSVFTKPFALMVRLFANITAGHIIILSLVSLIFIFGNAGHNLGGGIAGIAIAVPFVLFMNVLELLVAFLQAFIFTILSALFIGQAVEEHH